jgi:hypothetical protein
MSEQKLLKNQSKVKKRPCLTSRIVSSAWIAFLSLLLAMSLYFQAPWKIAVLIFIFLFAAVILPRVYRKWFWAGVGCAAAVVIIWVLLPEEDAGWQPYIFDKEIATFEEKYAIPDGENAAVIYNQLLSDYDTDSFLAGLTKSELYELPMVVPWLRKEHPGIAAWLERHRATISKLQSASQIECCRFAIKPDVVNIGSMTERFRMMGKWAHLLITAANNDMAEGRIQEGLEKYIASLQIGKHQNQQSSLADFMAGNGIERCSMSQMKRYAVVGPVAEEQLNLIEQTLAEIKHDWSYELTAILDYEKLLAKNFWGLFYEVNPNGKIRFTPSSTSIIRKQLLRDIQEEPVMTYWHRRFMKASAILCWFCMPSAPQEVGAIIDASYERFYAMAKPDFNWQKGPREFSMHAIKFNPRYIAAMQLCVVEPAYYDVHNVYLRTIAQERGARLTVALRRYKKKNGSWPMSIDDVRPFAPEEIFIDPTNGSSFIYKLTDEGFTLYSKGKNNIDENDAYESDDWPIWPPTGLGYKAEKKEGTDV